MSRMRPAPFPVRLLVPLLLAAVVLAPTAAQAKEERTTLNVMADTEITALLEQVRQTTGYSIIWNPADKNIRGKKVTGGTKFVGTAADIFSQFRAFLTFYELVVVPLGEKETPTWAIVDARYASTIMRLKPVNVQLTEANLGEYEGKDGLYITTTIQVEHMNDLRNARNALTRIVTGSNIGNVTEVPDAKSFVVTDFAPNVVAIYRLLKRMDRPNVTSSTTAGKTIAIELEHATAMEAAGTLTQLFASPPPSPQARGRSPSWSAAPTAPRIVADARTNRLLVTGTAEAIAKVQEAVTLIDVRVPTAKTEVALVMLHNVKADQTAGALMELLRASPGMWNTGPRGIMPAVVADMQSNSLLISGSADAIRALQALIGQMDKTR